MSDVFDALEQEHAAIERMLGPLDDEDWGRPSSCAGWTVADVVLHLAQSEEMVAASAEPAPQARRWPASASTIDDVVERWVAAERGASPEEIFDRWRAASRRSVAVLRDADETARFAWATVPLKARTLATTRLAEHWIHANDIAEPLGLGYPDTDRLWNIARLAHRTIPYAFSRAGREDPPSVRLELTSPAGDEWVFGEEGASCVIRGTAGEFCRIAARRLDAADARTIRATGERSGDVLALVRTYA